MNEKALNGLVELKYSFTGGDEISHYDTIKTTPAPLKEYLSKILATKEWGEIYIYSHNFNIKLEYSNQVCKMIPPTVIDIIDKTVVDAHYDGGWSRGDWRLRIIDE
jgi:hypothetical protein